MDKINLLSVADDNASREQGLMFVRSMAEDSGMLFKFDSPRILSFWMQNTYLPLDIAFLDDKGTIIKTESMAPFSTRPVTSGRPCAMALEVPMGTLKRVGGSVGKVAKIDLEGMTVVFGE
jgi:uncharacterized membrane protein (UPF0127 family)